MKKCSLIIFVLLCSVSLQANWLDSLLGRKSEEEPAPEAAAGILNLGSVTDAFSKNVMDFSKSSGDALLKSLGGDLTEQVSSLAGMLGEDPENAGNLVSTLGSLGDTLTTTNWTAFLEGLSGLAGGQLGDSERASLTKTVELATAFGLQSFFKDSAQYDSVNSAVSSLQNGKYIDAIPPLKKLLDDAKLSDSQLAMVDSSVAYFSDLAKSRGSQMLKDGIGSMFGG
ncbi:MAG: hypothetical protein AAF212_06620 [Verrucomicrobiota bacterium]